LTTSKRASWEMYGLGTKGGHFHYEQETALGSGQDQWLCSVSTLQKPK